MKENDTLRRGVKCGKRELALSLANSEREPSRLANPSRPKPAHMRPASHGDWQRGAAAGGKISHIEQFVEASRSWAYCSQRDISEAFPRRRKVSASARSVASGSREKSSR